MMKAKMIEQLNNIRDLVIEAPHDTTCLWLQDSDCFCDCWKQEAFNNITQLEAMVGEPLPSFQDDAAVDSFLTPARVITLSAKHPAALVRGLARRAASLTAAPVAQQPHPYRNADTGVYGPEYQGQDAQAPQQAEAVPSDAVRAAEREACARQCEDIYSWRGAYSAGLMCTRTLEAAAAAIRAR